MARCPSCRSQNLRDNYHPAPLLYRLFGYRALICNDCNRQFHGFALHSPTGGVDPYAIPKNEMSIEEQLAEMERSRFASVNTPAAQPTGDLRFLAPTAATPPARRERVTVALLPELPLEEVAHGNRTLANNESGAHILPFQPPSNEDRNKTPIELKAAEPDEKLPPCPQCGSYKVRRRLRKRLERVTVAMLDNEAFHCDHCQTPFYSSPEDDFIDRPTIGS